MNDTNDSKLLFKSRGAAYTSKIETYVLEVLEVHCQHIDPVKLTNVLAKIWYDRHRAQIAGIKKQLEQIEAEQERMSDSWIARDDSDIPPSA
tara:strand:- start:310 stop:585 length:276 start_codon:yes stop_codon:yes gene_type:complete